MPAAATFAVLTAAAIMVVVQVHMPLVDARRDLKTLVSSWSSNDNWDGGWSSSWNSAPSGSWNAGWSSSWSGVPAVAVTAPGVNVNVAGQGQQQQPSSSGGGGGGAASSSAASTASNGVYVTAPGTTVTVGGGGGGGGAAKGPAPGSASGGGGSKSSAEVGTSSSHSGDGGGGGGNGGVLVTAPGTVVTVGGGGGGSGGGSASSAGASSSASGSGAGGGGGVQVKAPYTTVSVDSQAKTNKDSGCVAVSGVGQFGWGKGCRRSRNLQQVDVLAGKSGAVRVGDKVNVKWGRHRHRSLQSDGTTVVSAPTTNVKDTSSQTNVRNPWADVTVNKGSNGGGCVKVPGTTTVSWGQQGCTRP